MFWALYMRFFMVRDSCVMTAACLPPPRRHFRCRSGHRMSLNPVHTSDHNTWHHQCDPQKTSATTMMLQSVQMLNPVPLFVIFNKRGWRHTSLILKKAIPVRSESDPAWCWGPILSNSSCSATSCRPPCTSHDGNQTQIPSIHTHCYKWK